MRSGSYRRLERVWHGRMIHRPLDDRAPVQVGGSSSLQGCGPLRAEDSRHQHTVPHQAMAGKVSQRCILQLAVRKERRWPERPMSERCSPRPEAP
jgi:hypothetical protein